MAVTTITAHWIDSEGKAFTTTGYSNESIESMRSQVYDDPINPLDNSLQAKLQALSDCTLTKISMSEEGPKKNFDRPSEHVDGEAKAEFKFRTAEGALFSMSVPGFKRQYLRKDGDDVIRSDTWTQGENPPEDLIQYMLDDQWFGNGGFTNAYEQDLRYFVSAKEKFVPRRK